MCFVTSKILLQTKGKGFGLDLPCNSSSLIFNSKYIFSLFQFQCILLFLALISYHFLQFLVLISHVLIFLFPFLFVFLSLILPFLTLFSLVLIILLTSYLLILMFPNLLCPLALLSHVSISLHALHFLPLFCSHVLTLIFPSQLAF